jgi:hypothetical protein
MRKNLWLLVLLIFIIVPFSSILTANRSDNIVSLGNSTLHSNFTMGGVTIISSVGSTKDVVPTIAMDKNGVVHIAFYDDTHNILYYTSSSSYFATLTVVASGGASEFERPRIFVDSNNIVHIFYGIVIGTARSLWYVNNSGGVFAPHVNLSAITNVFSLYSNYDVAMGSNDIFHIASMSEDEIYYFTVKEGSCSSPDLLSIEDSDMDGIPQVAIGQYIMVAWYWYPGGVEGEILLRYRIPGLSWSPIDNITNTFGELNRNPGLTLDQSGCFHIMYENSTGNTHLSYCTNKNGSIAYHDFNFPWKTNTRPMLKTDSNSAVHAMWYDDKSGNNEIIYITNVNGSFEYYNLTKNAFADQSPNFVIDSLDNIHLVYSSDRNGNFDICYQVITYNEPPGGNGIPGWDLLFIIPPIALTITLFIYRKRK